MDAPSEDRRLGDYLLKQCIAEDALTVTWLAEQASVGRTVLIDELKPEAWAESSAFLADVRAKAAVDHPLIGSVYEAVDEPGCCFYAHELLPGVTFADRLRASEPLAPGKLAHLLRRIAEAGMHLEARGQASAPLDPAAIHLDEHGVLRLKNLVIAGARDAEMSRRDLMRLGADLLPLVADGRPGATRMQTLLGWMRGEDIPQQLGWADVRGYCEQIEQQLAEPLPDEVPRTAALRRGKKKPAVVFAALSVFGLIVIGVAALKTRPKSPPVPPRQPLPEAVSIPAGTHPTPDGLRQELPAFRLSAHEVTIGEYAAFLETLSLLVDAGRAGIFDHKEQPEEKTGHEPDDWAAMLAAAKAGGSRQGGAVTLDSPVTGVDWWDASAYAEWKQARLPSQEEWFAALSKGAKDPAALKPGPWQSVTDETPDRTENGLLGMAGSVSEWTARPAPNPSNPLGGNLWVIIGGSHLKPGNGALTREWVEDRSLRRPDLGFRLLFEEK